MIRIHIKLVGLRLNKVIYYRGKLKKVIFQVFTGAELYSFRNSFNKERENRKMMRVHNQLCELSKTES